MAKKEWKGKKMDLTPKAKPSEELMQAVKELPEEVTHIQIEATTQESLNRMELLADIHESESPAPSIDDQAFPEIDISGYETGGAPKGDLPPIENGAPIGEYSAIPGCLTKEQFYKAVFKPMHDVPGAIMRLESLPIKQTEEPAAIEASNAIYDIAAEVEIFRFLIQPGNIWVQRAVVIGAFTVPKAMAVRAELQARQMRVAEDAESAVAGGGE